MSNVEFSYSTDGKTVYGTIPDGTRFCIDADMVEIIKDKSFYRCRQGYGSEYLTDCHGIKLHEYLYPHKYYLSKKACQGILRRASARGKQLPQMLKIALEQQAETAQY